MKAGSRPVCAMLAVGLAAIAASCLAQSPAPERLRSSPDIEELNFVGGASSMPPLADSNVDVHSAYREGMLRHGAALRLIVQTQYVQNTLAAPVPAHDQAYVGQRPFEAAMDHTVFTSNLRQLGLRHAQLYLSGVWNWVSWEPAGPRVLRIWDFLYYQSLAQGRVEVKVGYISNNLEFMGMMVGGSTANGGQGVYAVLPFESGMSYFPMAVPGVNVRIAGPGRTYFKGGVQRSMDPRGGPVEEERNHSGFRFAPKGDGALQIYEAGYRRDAAANQREMWLRGGYQQNSTEYPDFRSGALAAGNSTAYALADRQLSNTDVDRPWLGVYAGVSAMTAPSRFNAYDRYLEARLYKEGTFTRRPEDMASVVASYTGHSKFLTDALKAQGNSVWRAGATLTGSYSVHVRPGQYLGLGLAWLHGPALSPRVNDALTFNSSYTVFF